MGEDKSKESAAKFLLGEVIDFLLDEPSFGFSNALQSGALKLRADAEGWAELVCSGKSASGYGTLSFSYKPRDFVIKLYEEAERKFDELTVRSRYANEGVIKQVLLRDNVTEEYREQAIRDAVRIAIITVLAQVMLTLGRTLRDQYRDALTVAVAALEMTSVDSFEGQTFEEDGDKVTVLEVERRVKSLVEKTVKDVSDEKRAYLAALFSNIAALQVSTGKVGRPLGTTKPAEQKARERAEFEEKIEETIQALLSVSGEMPTKTAVARELGVGGLNPGTGIDSSLNAFNNKLKRLEIDYLAIERRVGLNK